MGQISKKQKTTNFIAPPPPSQPPPPPPLDRLSSLPDDILGDILLLLPTKTAVTTSVLSHRWHFLWTQATSLTLDCRDYPLQTSEFYTVVDQLLTRLTSPLLRTFSIRAPYPSHPHFEPWLRILCSRNVEKIGISFDSLNDLSKTSPLPLTLTLPHCVFLTESLVCLNLSSCGVKCVFPDDDSRLVIKLPNLKRLSLRLKLRASQCGFVAKIVRSCPLLEDLSLTAVESPIKVGQTNGNANGVVIDVSCRNLIHLTLFLFSATENIRVVIDAPKLDCLALYACRLASFSFVKKPITLREALIHIIGQSQDLLLLLFPRISDITVLDIRGKSIGMFEGCKNDQGKSLAFSNLSELRLQFNGESSDEVDDFTFESTSPSMLLRVKRIKIILRKVMHMNNFKKLAEYLLSNAPSLEKLTFLVRPQSEDTEKYKEEEMLLCKDLNLFSRNFPQCLIEFSTQHAQLRPL